MSQWRSQSKVDALIKQAKVHCNWIEASSQQPQNESLIVKEAKDLSFVVSELFVELAKPDYYTSDEYLRSSKAWEEDTKNPYFK